MVDFDGRKVEGRLRLDGRHVLCVRSSAFAVDHNVTESSLNRFLFNHYCAWFRAGSFAKAIASIPMLNMTDDHDLIGAFSLGIELLQLITSFRRLWQLSRRTATFSSLFSHWRARLLLVYAVSKLLRPRGRWHVRG